jgi:hypothetical protein
VAPVEAFGLYRWPPNVGVTQTLFPSTSGVALIAEPRSTDQATAPVGATKLWVNSCGTFVSEAPAFRRLSGLRTV